MTHTHIDVSSLGFHKWLVFYRLDTHMQTTTCLRLLHYMYFGHLLPGTLHNFWSTSSICATGSCEWQTSTSSRRNSCLTACCFFWPFPDERLQVALLTTTCTRRCVDARISVLFWFSYLQHMSSVWTTVPMFGSPKNINNIQQLIQLSRSSIDL